MPNIRKPNEVHQLYGTYRKDRHGEPESQPQPKGEIGSPPRHLTKEQKAAWQEFVKFSPDGVLKDSDRIHLEIACCLLAEFRADPLEFPAARMTVLNKSLGHMAMTPSDRHKVVVMPEKEPEHDPWNEFK